MLAGKHPDFHARDQARILLAPDHKIANNLFKLVKEDAMFHQNFVAEFPLLHLRKSKIVNLLSGYKDAGLLTLTKYLQDSEETELNKMVRPEMIESATVFVKRLAMTLHVVFMILFLKSLPPDEADDISKSLEQEDEAAAAKAWSNKMEVFMETGCNTNATFSMHVDILRHCEEVLAIALAEKVGGPDGYALLLAAVKSSLRFAFLNGASSYAGFCIQLLVEHHSAGIFHQRMKETLFTTPFRGSKRNFALDTQREMEHKVALKGFRPRSTLPSVLPRMALVDNYMEMEETELFDEKVDEPAMDNENDVELTWKTTAKDLQFVVPTAEMILRTNGLSATEYDDTPRNIYSGDKPVLADTILDSKSREGGTYLIHRFLCDNKLMGMTAKDMISADDIPVPPTLKTKLKAGKSTTIKRVTCKPPTAFSTPVKKEKQRQAAVRKKSKEIDCLSSNMNTCQAIMTPDCTKLATGKAKYVKEAIVRVLYKLTSGNHTGNVQQAEEEASLEQLGLLYLNKPTMPPRLLADASLAVVEFAGVKFKVTAKTGDEYVDFVKDNLNWRVLRPCPRLRELVIVEEKYSFTPDAMKAATRSTRKTAASKSSHHHLKAASEMLNADHFNPKAATSTDTGKRVISTYLAANIHALGIEKDVKVIVDSEHKMQICDCMGACACEGPSATPLQATFTRDGFQECTEMPIRQRKGEAEVAQLDWLLDRLPSMKPKEPAVSFVTSGDIDAVVLHLFLVGHRWPRNSDGSFVHPLFVVLLKRGGTCDVYNITSIVRELESAYQQKASMHIALVLCMGGNDYLPKFYNITHSKVLETVLAEKALERLFDLRFDEFGRCESGNLVEDEYLGIMKALYCPANYNPARLSLDAVRQITIEGLRGKSYSNPQLWMPPKEVLGQIADIMNWQIAYMLTAGDHESPLPVCQGFSLYSAMNRVSGPGDICSIPRTMMTASLACAKRKQPKKAAAGTPQKKGRKREADDTPQKGRNRKKTALSKQL